MCIRFRFLAFSLGLLAPLVSLSSAQDNADRIKTIQTNLNNAKAAYEQLPDTVKKSARGLGRLADLSDKVNRIAPNLAKGAKSEWQPDTGWDQGGEDENGLVQVNNPARDLRFSPFAGFTQNTSSTARCGDNVVVAFNDSGSTLETLATGLGGVSFINGPIVGTGGISMSGVANSRDGGETFRDRGAIPTGPDVNTTLIGRPSVACSDQGHFLIAQMAANKSPDGPLFPALGIAVSRSNDGGANWGDPLFIASGNFLNPSNPLAEQYEDPAIAVDPSNPMRVHVAYVHLNFGGPPCFLTYNIEVASSNDGGKTFGATPVVLDTECFTSTTTAAIGPRIGVSSKGKVYVAFAIDIQISTTLNQLAIGVGSFQPGSPANPPVVVDAVSPGGLFIFEPFEGFGFLSPFIDEQALQGGFSDLRGFDLAVDHSGGPNDGTVYLAWDDSRNGTLVGAPEFEDDFTGFYNFTDIVFSTSTDGGQTFAPTRQLNSDLQPTTSRGHDHFRPVLAVDRNGKVAACWYDRRNDPENYQFERFCAESTNAGATWKEFGIPGSLTTPSRGEDFLILQDDMGQNDNLATDFIGHAPGFIGGIQWMSSGMNPDVKVVRFR